MEVAVKKAYHYNASHPDEPTGERISLDLGKAGYNNLMYLAGLRQFAVLVLDQTAPEAEVTTRGLVKTPSGHEKWKEKVVTVVLRGSGYKIKK